MWATAQALYSFAMYRQMLQRETPASAEISEANQFALRNSDLMRVNATDLKVVITTLIGTATFVYLFVLWQFGIVHDLKSLAIGEDPIELKDITDLVYSTWLLLLSWAFNLNI